jgi:glc operon protein GlcG
MTDALVESLSLTWREARDTVNRAIDKARELELAGAIVVLDGGGAVVSISRMDGAAPSSIESARHKAQLSALTHLPSADVAVAVELGKVLVPLTGAVDNGSTFDVTGGMPIFKGKRCVGAIAIGGIGQQTGQEAEHQIVSHALGIPYEPRGDNWTYDRASDVSLPLPLSEARTIVDRAIGQAQQDGARVTVTVLDEYGAILQQDRMDGAAAMMVDLGQAKAATALNFQRPSSEVGKQFQDRPERRLIMGNIVRFKIQPDGGGIPISRGGRTIGAIGVAGVVGEKSEEIARAALG